MISPSADRANLSAGDLAERASHESLQTQTRSVRPRSRHAARAARTLALGAAIAIALWGGIWPCPTAHLFHVPCPGCGSSRATRALLTGDFHGVLVNPFGPLVAFAFALLFVRAAWLEYTDGNLQRLDREWGAVITRGLVLVAAAEIALWIFRWFGLFGGPVPV